MQELVSNKSELSDEHLKLIFSLCVVILDVAIRYLVKSSQYRKTLPTALGLILMVYSLVLLQLWFSVS